MLSPSCENQQTRYVRRFNLHGRLRFCKGIAIRRFLLFFAERRKPNALSAKLKHCFFRVCSCEDALSCLQFQGRRGRKDPRKAGEAFAEHGAL